MFKRIALMFLVSLLISAVVSAIMSFLGIGSYITSNGLQYGSLMAFCLLWGIAGSMITLLISKQLAKWTMGVQIIESPQADQYNIVNTVHRLSKKAGLQVMPEVGVYQSDDINAFATGRSRNNSLVAVSTGLLNQMNEDEREGVLAHEVAHIANGDMVTMALVQGIINAFVMFISRILAFTISQALRKDEDDSAPSPMVNTMITFALDIILGFLAMPIIAWFSRYREFRADAGGASLAGKEKMVAALRKLKNTYERTIESKEEINSNYQTMQISSRSKIIKWLSTHPPLEDRIEALK